jgi:hypothetical protein
MLQAGWESHPGLRVLAQSHPPSQPAYLDGTPAIRFGGETEGTILITKTFSAGTCDIQPQT